jgi:16S rRNA (adenine1518-N6/adenine1519-N6)-dimethyltransferase
MTELLGAKRVRMLLDAYGASPKRSLGQNFVIDPNTIRKVVDVADIGRDDHVLEIGAGCGSLTLGLAERARRVTGVEIDDRLVALLGESLSGTSNVDVIHADASTIDLGSIDASVLVANLPYNIATHLVLRVLQEAPQIMRLVVMTQKEVGERLASGPGSKSYGQISVMVRYFGHAHVAAQISRRAFFPVPNVDSVLVRVTRETPPDVDRERLFEVVRAAFSQRRKTLRNTIASVTGSTDLAAAALERAGVLPTARAEELGLDEFVALTKAIG